MFVNNIFQVEVKKNIENYNFNTKLVNNICINQNYYELRLICINYTYVTVQVWNIIFKSFILVEMKKSVILTLFCFLKQTWLYLDFC